MSKAQRCPVCLGEGVVKDPFLPGQKKPCHGCGGKGWVVVPLTPMPPLKKWKPVNVPEKWEKS